MKEATYSTANNKVADDFVMKGGKISLDMVLTLISRE